MPDPKAVQPAPAEPAERTRLDRERVLIRSYPKTIFLYPVGLAALLCGVLTAFDVVDPRTLGLAFTALLFVNVVVISFEFRRSTPLVLLLVAIVLVLAGVLLNERLNLVGWIETLYSKLDLRANDQFYFSIAVGYGLVLVGILLGARYDYWEVKGNEVLHHHGLFGDCERYPAPSMRVQKEIVDVFEYLLLGAGRLMIFPSGREQAIVLENVPRVNSIERRMEELLDSLRVTIERPDASGAP